MIQIHPRKTINGTWTFGEATLKGDVLSRPFPNDIILWITGKLKLENVLKKLTDNNFNRCHMHTVYDYTIYYIYICPYIQMNEYIC